MGVAILVAAQQKIVTTRFAAGGGVGAFGYFVGWVCIVKPGAALVDRDDSIAWGHQIRLDDVVDRGRALGRSNSRSYRRRR